MDNLNTELPSDSIVIKMAAFREWISDKLMTAAAGFRLNPAAGSWLLHLDGKPILPSSLPFNLKISHPPFKWSYLTTVIAYN